MAADDNKGKGTGSGSGGGQATGTAPGGQQISGEQIFTTTEENKSGESFATTGAGASGGSSTGSSGENQTNLSDAVRDAVSGDTGKAKEMLNQAKSVTGEVASKALGQVQEKASTLVDTKTSDVAQSLTGVADTVRQFTEDLRSNQDAPVAQTVAQYGDTVVNQVEKLADYLDRADLNKLTRDLETFAKRNPVVFIGGAFAAGILLARFVKSSQARAASANRQLTAGKSNAGIAKKSGNTGVSVSGSTPAATGEPPALGKTLPSVDSPATGANTSDTGTKPAA